VYKKSQILEKKNSRKMKLKEKNKNRNKNNRKKNNLWISMMISYTTNLWSNAILKRNDLAIFLKCHSIS
jgi:hypothetical protein